ncbi:MAG: hypothetical protein N2317_08625 [Syntrophales bacterium]|nr:hypothetical protein [Syntrophales bacterium]
MSVAQMRNAIVKVYPGEKWKQKVLKMSDGQVIAVYHNFLSSKKLK